MLISEAAASTAAASHSSSLSSVAIKGSLQHSPHVFVISKRKTTEYGILRPTENASARSLGKKNVQEFGIEMSAIQLLLNTYVSVALEEHVSLLRLGYHMNTYKPLVEYHYHIIYSECIIATCSNRNVCVAKSKRPEGWM